MCNKGTALNSIGKTYDTILSIVRLVSEGTNIREKSPKIIVGGEHKNDQLIKMDLVLLCHWLVLKVKIVTIVARVQEPNWF